MGRLPERRDRNAPRSEDTVNGVTRGIVRDVDAARARLLAEFPWMGPGELGRWAPVAGTYFMPEPGDEVLVAFDQGRLDHPYVIGCLWSNADQPPANDQHMRTIRSVNGHEITIFDPPATGGDSARQLADHHFRRRCHPDQRAQRDDERPRGRSGRTAYLVDSTRNNYLAHLSVLAILFA